MENLLLRIEELFSKLVIELENHNKTFFIENDDVDSYGGYVYLDGSECNESDFTIYSDSDKYGYYNSWAIQRLENGVLYLVGVGDTEGEKIVKVNELNYEELFNLAKLCGI